MGTNDISATKSAGDIIDQTWYNNLRSALIGAFVPRDPSTGVVGSAPNLGAPLSPWGNIYASGLVIGGTAIDFSNLTGAANAIISGKVRSTSAFPDFIRANGSAASFQILGSTTNLILNINAVAATVSADITKSSLTVAPSSNNTCTINDATLAGATSTKYVGEGNTVLTIATAGTEITNRIGQYCIFKTGAEYMLAYIKSATQLINIKRGYFFDSAGAPIPRVGISNGDTLTIMSTGWVFIENDGATVDVTYTTPKYAYTAPSSPATGDYWYDLVNNVWKRYSGSAFVQINRILVGVVAINTTACIASRSFDFNDSFIATNTVSIKYENATTISAVEDNFNISVYGHEVTSQFTRYNWDITTALEAGQTEAANTFYFVYITDQGKAVLSNIKPYDMRGTLKGWYHPFNAWRSIGYVNNNSSSDFDSASVVNYSDTLTTNLDAFSRVPASADKLAYFTDDRTMAGTTLTSFARTLLDDADQATAKTTLGITVPNQQTFNSSGTWTKPSSGTYAKVQVWGAGGGGGGGGGFGSGGGGGSYKEATFLLSALGATETVTLNAAGAGGTGTNNGGNGGTSTFGSWITAYGGTGGNGSSVGVVGGAGGGMFATATAGTRFNDLSDGTAVTEGTGGNSTRGISGDFTGGGGGSGSGSNKGGNSIYGGGGGAGGNASPGGGSSSFGGAGGNTNSAGTQPGGGGGGGSSTNGGAGALGRVVVYTW